MKMRASGLIFVSLALTSAVIGNAYYNKKQFYPSVVYITKSNPSMAVIYLQALILVYLLGKLMRKLFFGELRAAEVEHLMERSWYAITETCLAFTVFRDDFSPKFVALFTLLLFLKSFHWLAEDRVDFMERSPVISLLFHVRVVSLLVLLGSLDSTFIEHAYQSTMTKGASVQLVFGFEYAILATIIMNIAIKYALHTVDLQSEAPWENKAVFLLYTELVMGFIKVCLYMTFVGIMIRLYTLPLFAFRPMYYTMRKFKQAYNDVILSRRAIQNMNTLYPDATPEELAAADNVCIICREEMTTASKKLPCNHIFHTACLRSWFQRQQTCPTCRLNILRTPPPQQVPPPPQRPFAFWQQPPQPPGAAAPQPGPAGEQRPTPRFATLPTPPHPPVYPPLMGLFPPPPLPPANYAGLSDEELARMEGQTRENIEARLRCLRQIELFLNASSVLMNQYMIVVQEAAFRSAVSSMQTPGPSGMAASSADANSASTSANERPGDTQADNVTVLQETNDSNKPNTVPSSSTQVPEDSTTSLPPPSPYVEATAASASSASPNNSPTHSGNTPSQQEELRRLRLQKFTQE